RGTRPSLLRPTSITARPFSIAVTVPLTTRPSKPSSPAPPSCSLSSASKSARVGLAEVAIGCCILVHVFSGQAVGSAGLLARLSAGRDAVAEVLGKRGAGGAEMQAGADKPPNRDRQCQRKPAADRTHASVERARA